MEHISISLGLFKKSVVLRSLYKCWRRALSGSKEMDRRDSAGIDLQMASDLQGDGGSALDFAGKFVIFGLQGDEPLDGWWISDFKGDAEIFLVELADGFPTWPLAPSVINSHDPSMMDQVWQGLMAVDESCRWRRRLAGSRRRQGIKLQAGASEATCLRCYRGSNFWQGRQKL